MGNWYTKNKKSVLLIGAFVSRLVYPSSVRFVKNRLKLDGFLNIHMVFILNKKFKGYFTIYFYE